MNGRPLGPIYGCVSGLLREVFDYYSTGMRENQAQKADLCDAECQDRSRTATDAKQS